MDLDSIYKKVKQETTELVQREKELRKRLDEIQKLKTQNRERKRNVKELEAKLKKELEAFEDL